MNTVKAYIDLQALRFNIEKIKDTLPKCKIVSVIKADAYGHGSVACAKALDDLVECFAVARIEEAIELREAGVSKNIILLGGFFLEDELPLVENMIYLLLFMMYGKLRFSKNIKHLRKLRVGARLILVCNV